MRGKYFLIWGALDDNALSKIKKEAKRAEILIPEIRPALLGLRHNASILKKKKLRFCCCNDNALGFFFYKGLIKKVFIFASKINKQGFWAVSGTLYVFLLTKLHNVAYEILLQKNSKFQSPDKDASSLGGRTMVADKRKKDIIIPCKEFIRLRKKITVSL